MPVPVPRPGDEGKRRVYLILVTSGLIAAAILLVEAPPEAPATYVQLITVITLDVFLLFGLVSRRLPMPWADVLLFAMLAISVAFPLVAWHVDARVLASDTDALAVLLWSVLLMPLAFVVFGTRRGLWVSVATIVVLAVLITPAVAPSPLSARSPIVVGAAQHLGFIHVGVVALVWLLSRRLEHLTRARARADLLAEQAMTDPLTRIANRRRLTDELDALIANAQRHQRPLSVMISDIDWFKRVNDTYGHDVGDQVLIEVARRLGHTVRAGDLIGRWGGEEFVVIAPESDLDDTVQLAERCREATRSAPFEAIGTITASFGVATLAADDDRRSLLRRADLALYTAKNQGRDQVVAINGVHSPEDLPTADRPESGS